MKRIHLIILMALLSVLTVDAKKHKQLVILHTNDTHSAIMPLNVNLDNKDLAGRGGFLRRINMIKEERKQNPDLLEFDFGMENMARIFRMANFPVVCSNYDCTGTVLEGLVKPYITIKRGDVKIGVFALAPKMKGLVFDGNCEGITYLDPAETAQKYIDILRKKEKCDLVICVSHLGWAVSDYPDEKFIKLTEGCDLVLGGHTHTYMSTLEYAPNKNGKMIPVDQNGKHGVFIGKLILDLEK